MGTSEESCNFELKIVPKRDDGRVNMVLNIADWVNAEVGEACFVCQCAFDQE